MGCHQAGHCCWLQQFWAQQQWPVQAAVPRLLLLHYSEQQQQQQ